MHRESKLVGASRETHAGLAPVLQRAVTFNNVPPAKGGSPYGRTTVPVADAGERRLFAVAAFNAGEGRVAEAQARARNAGGDPTRFADVRPFLPSITQTYVGRVAGYAAESA